MTASMTRSNRRPTFPAPPPAVAAALPRGASIVNLARGAHVVEADLLEALATADVIVLDKTGNTSSASIPLTLNQALEDGRVRDGDLVLFVGFGAGMSAASAVVRWNTTDPELVPESGEASA